MFSSKYSQEAAKRSFLSRFGGSKKMLLIAGRYLALFDYIRPVG
jgi:hypothetical protein